MLIYDTNYENYNLLGKNIIAHHNNRTLLKVSVFTSLLKQYHTNIQEPPNEQRGKKPEKEATELGIPCIIPTTYAFFGG